MPAEKKRESLSREEYIRELDAWCQRQEKQPLYALISILSVFALGIFALFLSTWASEATRAAAEARAAMQPAPKMTGLQAFATAVFVPYLILSGAAVLAAAAWALTNAQRCPKCRRFFPRGKLQLYTQDQQSVMTLDGVGGAHERVVTTSVFWTECKHCGQIILVRR